MMHSTCKSYVNESVCWEEVHGAQSRLSRRLADFGGEGIFCPKPGQSLSFAPEATAVCVALWG